MGARRNNSADQVTARLGRAPLHGPCDLLSLAIFRVHTRLSLGLLTVALSALYTLPVHPNMKSPWSLT